MIKIDSKKIKKGDTFLAIRAVNTDGHDYIESAILNGATKIIAERGSYSVETEIVPNTREYLANYLKNKYSSNLSKIKLIGITGTNGKTTSAYMAYCLLNKMGLKTAYIGTIGFYLNDEVETLKNTTPELMDLYEMFDKCIQSNVKVIIMEVSSHSLEIGRVMGLEFDMVAWTNLTQDHLDVHETLENYRNAKVKLFKMLKNNKIAIINNDDESNKCFKLDNNKNITYGMNESNYQILNYNLYLDSLFFILKYENKEYNIELNLSGKYNIYNYVVCLIIVHKLGYSIEDIIKESVNIESPKGRFDMVKYNDSSIIIDYAHTPDAVQNILKSVNEYRTGKIFTIIGCGGNRDKTKRPIMGEIATKLSNYVIFTNDNPRNENESEIINDIIKDLKNNNYEVLHDRVEAIKKGISLLNKNDILLILGKGHENYQILNDKTIHHDDKECVLNYIH